MRLKFVGALALSVIVAACDGQETPIGPSSHSLSSSVVQSEGERVGIQADRRLPPVVPRPGLGCPTDAPLALITAAQVTPSTGRIDIEWAINPLSDQVRITILRREVTNQNVLYKFVREVMSKGESGIGIPVSDGIFTVTIQYEYNLRCNGLLSLGTTRVVGVASPAPLPTPKSPEYDD